MNLRNFDSNRDRKIGKAFKTIVLLLAGLVTAIVFLQTSFASSTALSESHKKNALCSQVSLPLIKGDPYLETCGQHNRYCENNNSPETAFGPLAPDRTYRAFPNDVDDFYYFVLNKPGPVKVFVSDFYAIGQVQVRDSNSNVVGFGYLDATDTGGNSALVEVDLAPGRYVIRLATATGANSNRLYTLSASYPYQPTVTTPPPPCPPVTVPEPDIPPGYQLFDHFAASGQPNPQKWTIRGTNKDRCTASQNDGKLRLSCDGLQNDNVLMALDSPEMDIDALAVATQVIQSGSLGKTTVLARLNNPQGVFVRAYAVELRLSSFAIVEYYPQSNWDSKLLATAALSSGAHLTAIQYSNGNLQFFVDNNPIQLTTPPTISPDYSWSSWSIEASVARSQSSPAQQLEADLHWTAVNPWANFSFETGTENWGTSEGWCKLAELETAEAPVFTGSQALKLTTELYDDGVINSCFPHTEATAYFNTAIPEGMPGSGPYDLTGKRVSCMVYLPASLATNPHQAYIRLFAKDDESHNQFGEYTAIDATRVEHWFRLSLTIGEGSGMDPAFRPQAVNALGVRIELLPGSTLAYEGPIYIDLCSIEYP